MQSDGRRDSINPTSTLASLKSKREKLQGELLNIEKQVYELETSYLQESSHFGQAFKGFDGVLSGSRNTTNTKRPRKFQPEDRIFSLSSVTAPMAEEQGVAQDDGRMEIGQVRPKGKTKEGKNGTKRRKESKAVE